MKYSYYLKTFLLIMLVAMVLVTSNQALSEVSTNFKKMDKIVFSSDRSEYDGDIILDHNIYMMNKDGTELMQLTNNQESDRSPELAPVTSENKNMILFTSNRNGYWNIYLMGIEGEISGPSAQQITLCPPFCNSHQQQPAWSPDGKEIIFDSNVAGSRDIYVMKLDGSSLLRLTTTPYDEQGPKWSSDGKGIVYVSDKFGNRDIWILEKVDMTTKNKRRLTCSVGDDAGPNWHPDGGSIIYSSFFNGRSHINEILDTNCSCDDLAYPQCQFNAITQGNFYDQDPAYSPNGRHIVFSTNRFDNFDIWRMKRNGKGMTPLTTNSAFESGPNWGKVEIPVAP